MKRVLLIYPLLTSYILPVIKGMAESGRVYLDVFYGPQPLGEGFGEHLPFKHPNIHWMQVEEKHPFGDRFGMYQKDILGHLIKMRPDAILIWANPRYLSFWVTLVAGRLLSIPVYSCGHGLFKKKGAGILHRIMYKTILALSQAYICYTPSVRDSLLPITKNGKKLEVGFNTLYNDYPVLPDCKTGTERGIFYIGRVRPGCGVDILIKAVNHLNQEKDLKIELHIIGAGPLTPFLQFEEKIKPWLHYYGAVYDQKQISEISQNCRIGCVPGFMGLNVVHMMSLSLPVVTHAQLDQHMGPEPEYIQHEVNGWLIEKPNNITSLVEKLSELWLMPAGKVRILQENAYKTYEKLNNPPFHERLLLIMEK
jgi:glycosyltransferase involved in cell wall biosynthesis